MLDLSCSCPPSLVKNKKVTIKAENSWYNLVVSFLLSPCKGGTGNKLQKLKTTIQIEMQGGLKVL